MTVFDLKANLNSLNLAQKMEGKYDESIFENLSLFRL